MVLVCTDTHQKLIEILDCNEGIDLIYNAAQGPVSVKRPSLSWQKPHLLENRFVRSGGGVSLAAWKGSSGLETMRSEKQMGYEPLVDLEYLYSSLSTGREKI